MISRAAALEEIAGQRFEVLVIGGGITGAGVALDAASRGLATALVERTDFAAGTSSMSSKMVHGGIRYLQQFEIQLVYQSLRERHRMLQNAPHLVRVLPFVMAIYNKGGMIPRWFAWALSPVLWFYDLTGGAKIGHRHRHLGRDATIAHMPVLDPERIHSSYLYYDAQVDDARMTMAIARTAALEHGAVIAKYSKRKQDVFERLRQFMAAGKNRRGARVEHDEIGPFTDIDRPDLIGEMQALGIAARRHVEKLGGSGLVTVEHLHLIGLAHGREHRVIRAAANIGGKAQGNRPLGLAQMFHAHEP